MKQSNLFSSATLAIRPGQDKWRDEDQDAINEEGRHLRDEGIAQVEGRRDDALKLWRENARRWIAGRARRPGTFNADDLVTAVGLPPGHRNAIGAVWMWANREGIVQVVGMTKAKRSSGHRRRVLLYRGTNASVGEGW